MNYKEILNKFRELVLKYTFVSGIVDIVKDENGEFVFNTFDEDTIYASTIDIGYNFELLKETFTECGGYDLKNEGLYNFDAILRYTPAQVGNYPPPNIEVPKHIELLEIEFALEMTKEERDRLHSIGKSDSEDIFKI